MSYIPTPADKEAVQAIEKLQKDLTHNMERFEWASANPARYITESILDIRITLFELARWQRLQAVEEQSKITAAG